MTDSDQWLTTGTYPDEPAATSALLAALGDTYFRPYREVPGRYLYARPNTAESQPRADLILRPHPAAVAAGWPAGSIGVECKRSGVKLGPVIAQVLDYQGAVFYPQSGSTAILTGTGIVPTYWALWPVGKIYGPLASILAQRRILTADVTYRGLGVVFRSAGRNVLRVNGEKLTAAALTDGHKRGAR